MTALFFYFIKVCICSGLLLSYYHLALRNKIFHQWNRFYLLAAVGLSLLLPLISFELLQPSKEDSADVIKLLQVVRNSEIVISETPEAAGMSWQTASAYLYLAVCVFMLAAMLMSLLRLFRLMRSEHRIELDGITVVESRAKGTPFSFLRHIFWNPAIDLSSPSGQQILQHEVVHVREGHTWDKLAMQTVLTLFWANPFFWIIRTELRSVHEFIADKKSLAGADAGALAALLLQTAYPQHASAFTNPFFYPSIKRRLAMIRKLATPQRSYLSRIVALPLIAIVAAAFTLKPTETRYGHIPASATSVYNAFSDTTAVYKPLHPGVRAVRPLNKTHLILDYRDGSTSTMASSKAKKEGLVKVMKYMVNSNELDTIPKTDFNSSEIESVNVISDSTVEVKFRNGKTGLFTAKDMRTKMGGHAIKVGPDGRQRSQYLPLNGKVKIKTGDTSYSTPLIFIDGEEYTQHKKAMEEMDPSTIESVTVLKDQSAIVKYGDRAKGGVILIKLKPGSKKPSKSTTQVDADRHRSFEGEVIQNKDNPNTFQVVFAKAEIEPGFPGGQDAWRKYLQKALDIEAVKKKGATEGMHSVKAKFIVNQDGTLERIEPLTQHGYGMEEQVINLLKRGPRWEPAMQNGRKVPAEHEVVITFLIV